MKPVYQNFWVDEREVANIQVMFHTLGMNEDRTAAEMSRIREPIVDGIFYKSDPQELRDEIETHLVDAKDRLEIRTGARAIISPHAGYPYCGSFVASAFLAATERPLSTVVIIAPVHREPEDAIYLTDSAFYATPIGPVPVAVDLVSELETCSTRIFRNDIPHLEEHAIEVQIPFIKHLFPDVPILPILMGRATVTNVKLLARALSATFEEKHDSTLYVVSSNLSNHTEESAAADSMHRLIDLIQRHDCEEILSSYHRQDITACGAGCIAAICSMKFPKSDIELLSRTNPDSGADESGKIIHYGALAFYP